MIDNDTDKPYPASYAKTTYPLILKSHWSRYQNNFRLITVPVVNIKAGTYDQMQVHSLGYYLLMCYVFISACMYSLLIKI